MKYIPFGQDKKELSEIVLGMMRISDKSVKEVEELVETALSVGINAFDLADIYGLLSLAPTVLQLQGYILLTRSSVGNDSGLISR